MELPHVDRTRAEGFGAVAEEYDAARPDYAPELVGLVTEGRRDAIDVGCGTGKLSVQLGAAGCRVLGIEPDERMAAVARRRGVDVEVGTFETWDAAGRHVDLVTSGTAWHWVDPDAGAAAAASVLRPGGLFAAMWNDYRHAPHVGEVLQRVYDRVAPGMYSFALGVQPPIPSEDDPVVVALLGCGFTGARPGMRTCATRLAHFTPAGWVALLSTFSDHRALPDGQRRELLAEVGSALTALGGDVPVSLTTSAVVATRP